MKRILPYLSIAVVLAACGGNTQNSAGSSAMAPSVGEAMTVKPDTAG